ncbi:AraC family transcriptional regulator [Acidovorax sp. SUPP3334]|uniref:AraC family transcriptional regulator n=1 Tax=Acidovorax sp. SUPP3334 TaxID=2920881 RepID=UPI0023DE3A3F|nr:AraC family transcriptional regulator [Acidovorax sp. SUPP3334]GKT20625.1 AraC family transcriptional regulator [Acidovorax sp. SUPP3334]
MTGLIAASALMHFSDLVAGLGGDAKAIMQAHGVDPSAAGCAEGLLSYSAVTAVIGRAAVQLDCPDFGMRLGQRQGIEILGPVALLMRHAETLEDALEGVSRYLYHCAPPDALELCRGSRSTAFSLEIAPWQLAHRDQTVEKGLMVAMQALRLVLGKEFVPLRVTMQHNPISTPETYQHYFGTRVEFGSDRNAIHLPNEQLHRGIEGRDPAVLSLAKYYLGQIDPVLPLAGRVQQLILRMLPGNQANLSSVAQALLIHPRFLQRKLAESGTSFEDILDQVRRDKAWYLSERGLQVRQIASMLGYHEPSSYARACRRWYGESPRQLIARRSRGH